MDPMTIGLLGGAALGAFNGSGQAGTVTTTNDVPDWLRPFVMNAVGGANQTLQNFTPSAVPGAAEGQMLSTINGDYLDPRSNPYLQETFQQGANAIRGQMSPSFGHMQAFGGNTGWQNAYGRALKDFGTNLFGGNYNAERGRQFQATMGGPAFGTGQAESAFAPFSTYSNVLRGWGSQNQQPYFTNPTANILGGALAGGALGRMFK